MNGQLTSAEWFIGMNGKLNSHSLYLAAFVHFSVSFAVPARSVEFEVAGVLSASQIRSRPDSKILFKASIADCKWFITVRDPLGEFPSIQSAFDGEAIYTVTEYGNDSEISNEKIKDPSIRGSGTGGYISQDEVPFYAPVPYVPIVWLAFGQSCYLDNHESELIPPFVTITPRQALRVLVERRNDRANLPERIVYVSNGFRPRFKMQWRHPYDKGFTNAIYTASQFTNLTDTISIPLAFNLTLFQPSRAGQNSNDLEIEAVYSAVVMEVQSRSSVNKFIPNLPTEKEVAIVDGRFGSEHTFIALSTNGWLSKQETSNSDRFKKWKLREESSGDSTLKTHHGNFAWSLFLSAFFFVPVAYALFRSVMKSKNPNS